MPHPYTTVIGLEVHVQLATESKLFCRCSTKFGAEPNTQTCPVCIGMPGSLPVMNRQAYELSLKTAVALNCDIPEFTKWDRKQYYYPDLPKGYQISQFDLPMSDDGYLEISDPKDKFPPKRVGIIRAHLEEDAGKSVHDEAAGKADSEIDLNRTGTPLLEIVSQPDMRSAAEARAFLQELKLLLTYIEVSDCNMQEGSLRVDANINLHIEKDGKRIATPIVEIKNMNSFRAVERALEYEAPRQYREWQETGRQLGEAPKQTRGWDDVAGVTRGQRSKEESSDYRYFPDPDLAPVITLTAKVDEVRNSLVVLPADLRRLLQNEFGLSYYDADVIVNQGRQDALLFVEAARQSGDPKATANLFMQEPLRVKKELNVGSVSELNLTQEVFVEVVRKASSGELPKPRMKEVILQIMQHGISEDGTIKKHTFTLQEIHEIIRSKYSDVIGMEKLTDICRRLLQQNPKIVADVQAGKSQALGALIGQAKKTYPNIDPNQFREVCLELIQVH